MALPRPSPVSGPAQCLLGRAGREAGSGWYPPRAGGGRKGEGMIGEEREGGCASTSEVRWPMLMTHRWTVTDARSPGSSQT